MSALGQKRTFADCEPGHVRNGSDVL